MRLGPFQINAGMAAAGVLLIAGAVVMLSSGDDRSLHTLGLGIVMLAGIVYLAARVTMLVKDRRR